MSKRLRAGLYARTSTTDQQSIPAKLAELKEFCERRGWIVTGEYTEQLSGADDERPERQKLIHQAQRGRVDVVLVYRLSRWSRSVIDLFHTIGELTGAGVAFVSTSEGFDLSTPTGRLVAGMLAIVAQFEREILNENVKAGIAEYRRVNGGKWGRSKTPDHLLTMIRQMHRLGQKPKAIIEATQLPRSTVYQEIAKLRSSD